MGRKERETRKILRGVTLLGKVLLSYKYVAVAASLVQATLGPENLLTITSSPVSVITVDLAI